MNLRCVIQRVDEGVRLPSVAALYCRTFCHVSFPFSRFLLVKVKGVEETGRELQETYKTTYLPLQPRPRGPKRGEINSCWWRYLTKQCPPPHPTHPTLPHTHTHKDGAVPASPLQKEWEGASVTMSKHLDGLQPEVRGHVPGSSEACWEFSCDPGGDAHVMSCLLKSSNIPIFFFNLRSFVNMCVKMENLKSTINSLFFLGF